MQKYGYRKTAACMLCQKAREECGGSWNGELPKETIGHIQSAGCLGQKEVVTAAHNACIRELLQEVNVHGKADRHMRLLTIETESRLGAANEGPPVPEEQYQERFWRRRLDGIGLDTINKELLAIEFKRTRDARSNYVERCVFITAVPITKLFAWGSGGIMEDMCYERR